MTQTFTADDVVRYAYNETNQEETNLIQEALMHDEELLGFYLDMLDVKLSLEKSYIEPPQRAIDNILAFACNYTKGHPTTER
jgi:hypothetical protein